MYKMEKWARMNYQPCLPLGDNFSRITGCRRHVDVARRAAVEGTVLLKNEDSVLPFAKGTKLAVFGLAQIDYVKGGGGSGDVHCEYVRNIYQGLKEKGNKVMVFDKLSLFYENTVRQAYRNGGENGRLTELAIPAELLAEAREFTDTAIITLCRYSREGYDRKNDGTDTYFTLSDEEKAMVKAVSETFRKVVVLLNTGAMIDTSWFADNDKIQAAVMIWQGGMEGGLAVADILVGDETPSGKLVDTCAVSCDDYPSTEGFHESEDYVKYIEDIFVGYRYFETVPGKKERVVYPFGYGLSYTTFALSGVSVVRLGDNVQVNVTVTNTGSCPGKEVVQLYYSAPKGKLEKPAKELCGFAKTKLLAPGESQVLCISYDVCQMASYDDLGVIQKSAYVMEPGEYKLFVGTSVRDITELDLKIELAENRITEQLSRLCAPENLDKRMLASGEFADVPERKVTRKTYPAGYHNEPRIPETKEDRKLLKEVAEGKLSLDEFISQLSDEELLGLLHGKASTGVCNIDGMGGLPEYGIPAPMTIDGPAGVRIFPETGVRTTAFPVATMLACSWNTELLEEVGACGALEVKENNLSIWLTPALNIHRSPLCGRNFEYYSEDPFVSGKMAAAMVRGIQSQRIAACPKHFACNNKETNRQESDSIVSERALREIYLKGFEICVKEADPKLIMTSYNLINGVRASENAELLTGILRKEWGYGGLVTTDWYNHASETKEVIAGNDIRMPLATTNDLLENYKKGNITRDQLAVCVKRLLKMILWLE